MKISELGVLFWFPWSRHRLGVDRAWPEGCNHTPWSETCVQTRPFPQDTGPSSAGSRETSLLRDSAGHPELLHPTHRGLCMGRGVHGPSTLQAASPNPLTVGESLGQVWRFGFPNKH